MTGQYVPLVLVPRFTTYIGEIEDSSMPYYATAPLDVSAYAMFTVTAWVGPLIGNTGHTPPASLSLDFEWSDDAETWSTFIGSTPITTPSSQTIVQQDLVHRWLRVKLTLVEDQDEVVAVTCWVIGNLERRET